MASTNKKLILVIGATGGQGIAVIDALLKPAADGSPSPYVVRALTRDTQSRRAKLLASRGVEVVEGDLDNYESIQKAVAGAEVVFAVRYSRCSAVFRLGTDYDVVSLQCRTAKELGRCSKESSLSTLRRKLE